MKAPFAIVPINNAVVRVLDAAGENVAVMPTRPATRLVVLVNTIPTLINTLKALSVAAWNAGNADLIDLACTGECAVRNIDPSFALIDFLRTTELVGLEESSLYAAALGTCDCSPAAPSAGVEGVPG